MTRETKIGLLVGLAFIILIGILLSDHLSVTAQPPQAALVQAGESVREGITVPGGPAQPAYTPAVPHEIHPTQRIPVRQELQAPRPEDTIVSIVPGHQNRQDAPVSIRYYQPQDNASAHTPYQVVTPEQVVGITPPAQPRYSLPEQPTTQLPVITETPVVINSELPPSLQQLAQHDELVAVDPRGNTQPTPADRRTPVQAREYVAKPGDSLSKIAARFYGRSTPESRALLVQANPSLKDNPNLILAGRTYLIPEQSITDAPAIQASSTLPAGARSSRNDLYIYTVKPGDSLWKIANEQLGDPAEVKTIKSLNDDVLKGGDVVRVGMKLRLPGQPVATAN